MSEKHFVGLNLTGVQDNGRQRPISRVTFLLDDENSVTAGDDTGSELLADCPHATQAMAEAILAQVQGYQYQMLNAADAALDPAAEPGDGVTAGGLYSILARISEDGSGYAGFSAPGEAELEDEFPADGPMTQAFNRKITQTRSQIIKTATEITQLVEDTASTLSTEFSVKLESITSTVTGLDGKVTTITQDAKKIVQRIESAEGSISTTLDLINGWTVKDDSGETHIRGSVIDTGSLNLTGAITFTDLDQSTQNQITDAANNASTAATDASSALDKANSAQNTVKNWTFSGTTKINGAMIQTGTVEASVLRGGTVQLLANTYDAYGNVIGAVEAGTFVINTEGAVGDRKGALQINSDAIRIQTTHRDGRLIIQNGEAPNSSLALEPDGTISIRGSLRPDTDGVYNLGFSNFRWNMVCLASSPLVTSDRTKKEELTYGLDRYGVFFDSLRPASFKFIDGQSGRTHLGMVSQDVEEALEFCALTDMDFAGFIRSPKKDEKGNELEGEYDYMLRYEEFIPLCIDQIQKLKARVAALETAAREAASAAAQSAQTAAGHAQKAEGSADAASGSASASSSEALKAQAAREAIENMGVSAEVLPPGSEASVSKTILQDGTVALKFGVPQGIRGPKGDTGSGILKIERTSGTGAPGTVDTYTITMTDGSETMFRVYNGADGNGVGDMLKRIYDPQNRAEDIFACIDSKQDTLHPITSAEIDEIWGEEGS